MKSIWSFLGITPPAAEAASAASSADTATVRKIVDALEHLDAERARYIAAFAFLLGRVANADLNISNEETEAMEKLVWDRADLPEEQAVLVVQIAKSQARLFGGTENFLVAREFNDIATREQKLALLDCLYSVSASDGHVSTAEDGEIGKIAAELRLEQRELAAARTRQREHLGTLKPH